MSSVTFSTAVGGDGSTVTDDDNVTTGLRNGGWRTRFVPCFTNQVNIAQFVVDSADDAATDAAAAASSASSASTSAGNASTSAGNASTSASNASSSASAAASSASSAAASALAAASATAGYRNRIINGAMMIDQRATSVTSSSYTVDRWAFNAVQASKATVAKSTSVYPAGFAASLGATSSSAYSVLSGDYFVFNQPIEGVNVADLAWGTANAKTVTLSFWVRSSLTGTFGGSLMNNSANRCYPFSYTINSANTWEYKTITISGDTTGTWNTDTNTGIYVFLSLGAGSTYSGTAGSWAAGNYRSSTGATSVVGTNGATFYITGVQLEKGSTATPFENRLYGTELALCQRYFTLSETTNASSDCAGSSDWYVTNGNAYMTTKSFKVSMRSSPTVTISNFISSNFGSASTNSPSASGFRISATATATGNGYFLYTWTASAEL